MRCELSGGGYLVGKGLGCGGELNHCDDGYDGDDGRGGVKVMGVMKMRMEVMKK